MWYHAIENVYIQTDMQIVNCENWLWDVNLHSGSMSSFRIPNRFRIDNIHFMRNETHMYICLYCRFEIDSLTTYSKYFSRIRKQCFKSYNSNGNWIWKQQNCQKSFCRPILMKSTIPIANLKTLGIFHYR